LLLGWRRRRWWWREVLLRLGLRRQVLLRLRLRRALHGMGLRLRRRGHMLGRYLCGRRLRWGYGMAPPLRALLWRLVREGGRSRRPSLFVRVRLHLVRVRLLLWVGILRVRLW
jgi:hypothetical protein